MAKVRVASSNLQNENKRKQGEITKNPILKRSDTLSLDKKNQKKVVEETKKLKKEIQKGSVVIDQKAKVISEEEKKGLIYIGHIPHGFYEDEMKAYFKQFGKITNVKVCRSNKNGNSKGYGYVEFAHPEVAKIAAESMHNYLMFKKRLVAQYIPYEKRPKQLFHGKSSTKTRIPRQIRRLKQFANSADEEKVKKSRLNRLCKKLRVLEKRGISSDFQPTDT